MSDNVNLPFRVERNPGYFEYWLPVSVKLVIDIDGKVPLLKNERDEWELPGGKLDEGETPEECVAREALEELNITVEAESHNILNSWVYKIAPMRHVFVVAYGASYHGVEEIRNSNEHKELGVFSYEEISSLNMPEPYKHAIREWRKRLG